MLGNVIFISLLSRLFFSQLIFQVEKGTHPKPFLTKICPSYWTVRKYFGKFLACSELAGTVRELSMNVLILIESALLYICRDHRMDKELLFEVQTCVNPIGEE